MTIVPDQMTESQATASRPAANPTDSRSKVLEMRPSVFSRAASVTGGVDQGIQARAQAVNASPISMDILYQGREAGSQQFLRAVELLGEACESLSEARAALAEGDKVGSASGVARFEQLLQPLFECRNIGDGYANVVNTIHFAIANLKGDLLTEAQITTLWRIIREIAGGPFLSFRDSLVFVKQLDKVGLRLGNRFLEEFAMEPMTGGE